MIKKIIYLASTRFNIRDSIRFGIKIMQENGFEVEVWDLSNVLYKNADKLVMPDSIESEVDYPLIRWNNKNDVIMAFQKLNSEMFVINLIGLNRKAQWIYNHIDTEYGLLLLGDIPWFTAKEEKMEHLFIKIKKMFSPRWLFNYFKFKHNSYVDRLIKKPCLILLGGAKREVPSLLVGENTKLIYMHTLDYDLYLDSKTSIENEIEEYIVFLDEWYPFHQDYIIQGIHSPATPTQYYKSINSFFYKIEKEFGVPVKIAAHPRSFYDALEYDQMDYYKGREIYRNRTHELIKNSKFVITHFSTSIGFAILYEKPLVFISTKQTEKSSEGIYEKNAARLLGKNVINVDKPLMLEKNGIMNIDKKLYQQYRNDYIKKEGTPEKKVFQILADELKKRGDI